MSANLPPYDPRLTVTGQLTHPTSDKRPSDDRSRGSRAIEKKEAILPDFHALQKENSAATSFACCVPVPCLVPCVKSRAVPISTAEVLVAS